MVNFEKKRPEKHRKYKRKTVISRSLLLCVNIIVENKNTRPSNSTYFERKKYFSVILAAEAKNGKIQEINGEMILNGCVREVEMRASSMK